jgi:glucosylceramidase
MKIKFLLIAAIACCTSCGCQSESSSENTTTETDTDTSSTVVTGETATVYVTTADKTKLFASEEVELGRAATMSPNAIRLNGETYQTIDGFGAAITVSSCYNLLQMSQSDRTSFLTNIFSMDEGLGSSLIRVCIGGSDFSIERYTWCDEEGIENFGIPEYDEKYLIPVLKEIYSINPDVKIIGSPWTAPQWMKVNADGTGTHYSWTGGTLGEDYYEDYAQYFVKWIQYMEGQGFDIYAITPQNEPLNAGNSMSMLMYWDVERDFIKVLGPALEAAGLDTKILVFDHNYNYDGIESQSNYAQHIYDDAEASQYAAGSAWHNYGGSYTELANVSEQAPDKEIYFTEASIGGWNYDFASCVISDMRDIFLGPMDYGCKGVTLWNLLLDEKSGPYTDADGSCTNCYGAVTIASTNYSTLDYYSQYYDIAHCSKVVHPGAVRLGTKGYTADDLYYQLFQNTDGSYAAVILNDSSSSAVDLVLVSTNHSVKYSVPAKSIVSILWED